MSVEGESREDLLRRIDELAAGSPYPSEAFVFVLQSLPQRDPQDAPRHIAAAELCWRIRALAIDAFGPDARRRLEDWSVRSCDDFGEIVFRMIDAGLMAKTEQDARDDFHDVFSFDAAFDAPADLGRGTGMFQCSLSTLFIVTTIAAVAFAGLARSGVAGAVGTVFAAWMGLIGLYCLVPALLRRQPGWLLGASFGLAFTVGAVLLFVSIVTH